MPKKLSRMENNIKSLTNMKNKAPDRYVKQIGELIDISKKQNNTERSNSQ